MAETLTELVAKITTDAAGLKSGLSDAEKQTEASSKKMQDSLKKVGTIMAASGAAITAAFGLMGKAALDEEINIKRLATTINNSGTAYDNVKDSLEAVIAATQRKTGVADDEQRNILNRLILVTNDYNKALELLPTVLDLAAAGEMDATTAATYLGKAFLELEDGADSVSVRFGQASLQFKNMEDIQNRVRGSAENLANPLNVLKASIGDVVEEIGMNLLPIIKPLLELLVDIAIKVQDWVKENPKLAQTLTITAGVIGVVSLAVGSLILLMPALTASVAAFGVTANLALAGLPIIIGAVTLAGVALWQNWDKVSHFFADVWSNMKNAVLHAVDAMLGYLQNFIGWLPFFGEKIAEAREKISNMIEAEKVKRDAADVERALEDVSEALEETTEIVELNTDATIEQTEAALANIAVLKEQKDELDAQSESLIDLAHQIMNTRQEYEYARSDAGKLGITVKDVTFALYDQGLTMADVGRVIRDMGEDANNVNKIMEAFGVTAQEVKDILDSQKDSVEGLADSYVTARNKMAALSPEERATRGEQESIDRARRTQDIFEEKALLATRNPDFLGSPEYAAEMKRAETAESWGIGNLVDVFEKWARRTGFELPSFKNGGFVNETGLAFLHSGETVIPANESMGVVVNFTQPVFFDREDTMNRFVDMISRGIDRKYRLSGRR